MRKDGQLLLGAKLADKLPSKNLGRELDTGAVSSARPPVVVVAVVAVEGFSVMVDTAMWKVVVTEPDTATEVISFSSRLLNPPDPDPDPDPSTCFNSA